MTTPTNSHKAWTDKGGHVTSSDFVFKGQRPGTHLTRQAIAFSMRKWGKLADLELHPHRLRHSHATHAVRRGVDVFTLQSTLGHASSATTGHFRSTRGNGAAGF